MASSAKALVDWSLPTMPYHHWWAVSCEMRKGWSAARREPGIQMSPGASMARPAADSAMRKVGYG